MVTRTGDTGHWTPGKKDIIRQQGITAHNSMQRKYYKCTHVTEMPPPSSLLPAVGLKLTVWSSAANTHSIRTVLSVSCAVSR